MRCYLLLCIAVLLSVGVAAQKNFIDQPYIEVSGSADTLVTPNEIFIKITLSEKDTRDRVTVEQLEQKMLIALKGLGINTETDMVVSDVISNYQFYLLKKKDVMKTKEYHLKVSTANQAANVFIKLEELDISNALIERVNHSELRSLQYACKEKAVRDARKKAGMMVSAVDQQLGSAIMITDSDNNNSYNNGVFADTRITLRGIRSLTAENSPQNYETNISFEKIKITSQVNVKFVLK